MAYQRKVKGLSCKVGEKRMTVVRVNGDDYDTHSGRSFQQAMAAAQPDRGSKIDVFVVCSHDVGAARLPSEYKKRGTMTRSFRYKGR